MYTPICIQLRVHVVHRDRVQGGQAGPARHTHQWGRRAATRHHWYVYCDMCVYCSVCVYGKSIVYFTGIWIACILQIFYTTYTYWDIYIQLILYCCYIYAHYIILPILPFYISPPRQSLWCRQVDMQQAQGTDPQAAVQGEYNVYTC